MIDIVRAKEAVEKEISMVEVGKWYEFRTKFDDERSKVMRGRVTEITEENIEFRKMHDAIPLTRLRKFYIMSCREMNEGEVLAECI